MRTFNMYPLSNFQKCNTVLTIVTMPSITPTWHIYFLTGSSYLFFRFYLFIFREGKEGRKRGRESSMCGCLSHIRNWEPSPQPRHVPWLEIEPASLCFSGWHSIHWVPPARTGSLYLLIPCPPLPLWFLYLRRLTVTTTNVVLLCSQGPYRPASVEKHWTEQRRTLKSLYGFMLFLLPGCQTHSSVSAYRTHRPWGEESQR